jgi:hypothetical protein
MPTRSRAGAQVPDSTVFAAGARAPARAPAAERVRACGRREVVQAYRATWRAPVDFRRRTRGENIFNIYINTKQRARRPNAGLLNAGPLPAGEAGSRLGHVT